MHDIHSGHHSDIFGQDGTHHATSFVPKPINFAAGNKSWRLICNSGNPKSCEQHCNKQFPGDALSIDECTKAVKEAFGSGVGACFPMNSQVTRRGDGAVSLSNLRVGDEILVSSESGTGLMFDPVIGFLHWSEETTHSFLNLKNETGGVLKIHKDHLLPVITKQSTPVYIRASDVKTDDQISMVWVDGSLVNSRVIDVYETLDLGLCCPLTMSGRIIVDSIACSCYSPPSNLLPMRISHAMCHTAMGPMRWSFAKSSVPAKREAGVHPYARMLMTAATGMIF